MSISILDTQSREFAGVSVKDWAISANFDALESDRSGMG